MLDSGGTSHMVVGYGEQRWDNRSFGVGLCWTVVGQQVIWWCVVLDSGGTFHLVVGFGGQRWDNRSFDGRL